VALALSSTVTCIRASSLCSQVPIHLIVTLVSSICTLFETRHHQLPFIMNTMLNVNVRPAVGIKTSRLHPAQRCVCQVVRAYSEAR
jgi:hypothetical protein